MASVNRKVDMGIRAGPGFSRIDEDKEAENTTPVCPGRTGANWCCVFETAIRLWVAATRLRARQSRALCAPIRWP
jgi:hypothetical protein